MKVTDNKTGKEETILQQTSNSYLITQSKLTKEGINCTQWFDERDFKERFKLINEQ